APSVAAARSLPDGLRIRPMSIPANSSESWTKYGDYTMSNGVGLMEGIGGFGADSIKAGDVICGLKGPGETIDPNDDGSWYAAHLDRKSTRLNSSHVSISY